MHICYACIMLNALETWLILDRIENPPPLAERFMHPDHDEDGERTLFLDEDTYEQAMQYWSEKAQERGERLQSLADAEELPGSPEDALHASLRLSAAEVQQAEEKRTKIIAVSVHVFHLPIRAIAGASGLNPRTVEKRANDPLGMEAVIEFKERELEMIREQARNGRADASDGD